MLIFYKIVKCFSSKYKSIKNKYGPKFKITFIVIIIPLVLNCKLVSFFVLVFYLIFDLMDEFVIFIYAIKLFDFIPFI